MNAPAEMEQVRITVRIEIRRPLNRMEVIKAARGFVGPWTVEELASAMEEREYRVRAAVGWLIHHGRAVIAGERVKVSPTGRAYGVTLYQIKDEKRPTDFVGLYAAFGMKG